MLRVTSILISVGPNHDRTPESLGEDTEFMKLSDTEQRAYSEIVEFFSSGPRPADIIKFRPSPETVAGNPGTRARAAREERQRFAYGRRAG
jgi:hypothetical protein